MSGPPPIRVEHVLPLLPDLEALEPLRTLLLSAARAEEGLLWASGGPYLTVGKRAVNPDEVRRDLPHLLERISAHVAFLYNAVADALERRQHDDLAGAVSALLVAGEREESVGRLTAAHAWYETARPLAATLQPRGLETECLRRLGRLGYVLGHYDDAARHFQRSLALAEAEFDHATTVAACEGLGDVARARGEWVGARAWYQRGLRIAEAATDTHRVARLHRRLGILAHRRGDLGAASEHLRHACEQFERLADPAELARALDARGVLDAALGREPEATAAYREALAWARRAADPELEVVVRLHLAELAIARGRLLEAEEELRRAEHIALARDLAPRLIRTYELMGRLRGLQVDETGFVFFEQAVELCRVLGRVRGDEARVYEEYGAFRRRLGQADEARAYLERARDLLEALGRPVELERVRAELAQLSA